MIKEIILAFLGSIFPAILFNIDKRKIFLAGLCGCIGWIAYSIVFQLAGSTVIASFLGAITVGMYSEFMARKVKTPATMFSIPGIFPLVPGLTGFNTVRYIVEDQLDLAFSKGTETIAVGGAIAFGIMLAATIVHFMSMFRLRRLDKGKQA